MLARLTRLSNECDEHFLNNDMCGLSQTRTVVRSNAVSTEQITGQLEERSPSPQRRSTYRHAVLIKAYMTRMGCQFRRGRTIVSDGRSEDDVGIVCKFMWQRGADLGAKARNLTVDRNLWQRS
jgi:hypothetical protein